MAIVEVVQRLYRSGVMDEYVPPRYTIELASRAKQKVADITRLAQDLDWSMTRNGVESLDFNMSMPD